MNKRIGILLVLIALVSLGVAIQTRVQLRRARAVVAEDLSGNPAVREIPAPAATAAVPVVANTAEVQRIQALQRQVSELQAERDKLQSDLAAARLALAEREKAAARPAAPPAIFTNASRRAAFEERMAQLKRDDPARYEEMQKQREEFRQRIQAQADERSEFLKKVDTVDMTDAQLANHQKLLDAVEQARAMMAQIASMSPEQVAAARQQMGQMIGEVSDLYQQERVYLLEQTGRAMGYSEAEAGQFSAYIQQIYDQTAMPRGLGFGGFGRGGPNAFATPGATRATPGTPAATPAPAAAR